MYFHLHCICLDKGVRAVFRGGAVISWCCIINPV